MRFRFYRKRWMILETTVTTQAGVDDCNSTLSASSLLVVNHKTCLYPFRFLTSVPPVCVSVGKGEVRGQLDCALQDVNVRYAVLEETEKRAVCRALIEERARYCSFVSMLKPVLVSAACVVIQIHQNATTSFKAYESTMTTLISSVCVFVGS